MENWKLKKKERNGNEKWLWIDKKITRQIINLKFKGDNVYLKAPGFSEKLKLIESMGIVIFHNSKHLIVI